MAFDKICNQASSDNLYFDLIAYMVVWVFRVNSVALFRMTSEVDCKDDVLVVVFQF